MKRGERKGRGICVRARVSGTYELPCVGVRGRVGAAQGDGGEREGGEEGDEGCQAHFGGGGDVLKVVGVEWVNFVVF